MNDVERRAERMKRRERTLIFDFNTLYNDTLFILLQWMKLYKSKLVPERGINFKNFTEHELISWMANSPYFNPLVKFLDTDVYPDSKEELTKLIDMIEKTLEIKENPEKSELFMSLKAFYEIGTVKIKKLKRSEEHDNDFKFYNEMVVEPYKLMDIFDPEYVLKEIRAFGATTVIHPHIDVLIEIAPQLSEMTFIIPIIGYNFETGFGEVRFTKHHEAIQELSMTKYHEFLEFWSFDTSVKHIGFGFLKGNQMTDYLEKLQAWSIEAGEKEESEEMTNEDSNLCRE